MRPEGRGATARIVLTPVRDDVDEENETVRITASTSAPLPFDPESLEVTIEDDDERGITLSRNSLRLSEEGSATYTVRLDSAPTGPVTVAPEVTDNPDVTVDPSDLTFDATDWSTAQTVTVEAGDDLDGDHEKATIEHRVSGADYDGETAPAVEVDVRDNDQPSRAVQLEVAPEEVIEDGGAQRVTVTATLDGAVRAVETVVTVTLSAGTASASDFEQPRPSVTVTIPAQEKSAETTFPFEPVEDFVDRERGDGAGPGDGDGAAGGFHGADDRRRRRDGACGSSRSRWSSARAGAWSTRWRLLRARRGR